MWERSEPGLRDSLRRELELLELDLEHLRGRRDRDDPSDREVIDEIRKLRCEAEDWKETVRDLRRPDGGEDDSRDEAFTREVMEALKELRDGFEELKRDLDECRDQDPRPDEERRRPSA